MPTRSPLAHLDHSLLAPDVRFEELERACDDARKFGFASVCLLPYFVPTAAKLLAGTTVAVSTVIGFPHGAAPTKAKIEEARLALEGGAKELDIVVNVSRLLSRQENDVEREIFEVTRYVQGAGGKVKWIFENALLGQREKTFLCAVCSAAGADWVKTSTGFAKTGATEDDVRLMRALCPPSVQVKASGGIRTLAEVEKFLSLGVSRIGTSRTVAIAEEWLRRSA